MSWLGQYNDISTDPPYMHTFGWMDGWNHELSFVLRMSVSAYASDLHVNGPDEPFSYFWLEKKNNGQENRKNVKSNAAQPPTALEARPLPFVTK